MELQLVYRALRKISEWAVYGFYCEVKVDGKENVPETDPVILTPTHHNEIIDIAALSTTIPYGRRVCFWAKSSLFRNPLAGAILSSSGAIPVYKNPNGVATQASPQLPQPPGYGNPNSGSTTRSLFATTSVALRKGDVAGVFPEGASYTEPGIVQLLSGAAWAAIECVRDNARANEGKGTNVKIIPVALVYTDKSKFQSRVRVEYGKAIDVGAFKEALLDDASGDVAKDIAKKLMGGVERQLFAMTINAKDWETLYAAYAARDILYPTPKSIPLKDWVPVSQRLVDILTPATPSVERTKSVLDKYYALLVRTGVRHTALEAVVPSSSSPCLACLLLPSLRGVIETTLFLPCLVTHVPGYIFGSLVQRFLATPGEEEGIAQFKAVGSGIGLAFYWTYLIPYLYRLLPASEFPRVQELNWLSRVLLYASTARVFIGWHGLLVRGMHERWRRVGGRYVLLSSLILRPVQGKEAELCEVLPPPPKQNARIRRRAGLEVTQGAEYREIGVASGRMAGLLLKRRQDAVRVLREFFDEEGQKGVRQWLIEKGARVSD